MTMNKLHRLVHRHARHTRSHGRIAYRHVPHAHRHARHAHRHVFVVTLMSWME